MPNHFPNREAILARQTAAGRELLALVISGNSFYREKLARAGLSEAATGVSPLIPFTTKSELADDQRAHPPFGTNLTFPLARYTRFHQTSGTAGAPLRWLDTPESWEAMVQCWLAVFHAAGVGPADRVYFAFSFGPFIGFWLAFEAATRLGCLCIPGGGLGSSARLRAILDNGATVICCTPTYALRLGDVAAEEKIDLAGARVRTFMVAGEPGGSIPATRARIAASWSGARVFDHHGMTEVGPVTHECPARPGVLHVLHAPQGHVAKEEEGVRRGREGDDEERVAHPEDECGKRDLHEKEHAERIGRTSAEVEQPAQKQGVTREHGRDERRRDYPRPADPGVQRDVAQRGQRDYRGERHYRQLDAEDE